MQLEKGSVATPFEFRDMASELLRCQRYYWRAESNVYYSGGQATLSSQAWKSFDLPVVMRADPTKAYTAAAISSLANAGISALPVVGTAYGLLDSQFDLSDRIGQWGADTIEADGRRIRENPRGMTFFPY